jgi:hypothetical protein
MITYRNLGLYGRLGNALFEFASTIGIGQAMNQQVMFPATWMHRPYFRVPDELFGDVPAEAEEATAVVQRAYDRQFDPRALPYLQDIELFMPWIDLIRRYLQPSEQAQEALAHYVLPPRPRLSVHVRRGDNVVDPGVPNKGDYHVCPPAEYYRQAIIQQALVHRWENVCFFSDDIPWCRENFPLADFYGDGVMHPKEHEPEFLTAVPRDWIDLFLMAQCDYHVVTGSTFGIWGALLAGNPPDTVIRPDRVFGPIVAEYTNSELMFDPLWRVCAVGPA